MKKKDATFHGLSLCLLLLLFTGCRSDGAIGGDELDEDLSSLLASIDPSGSEAFRLPDSDELDKIPQDPNNSLSPIKVMLGKFLFHETAIGLNPKGPENRGEFSCASCHFAEAGFQANRVQGIGEGADGFFHRNPSPGFPTVDLDVQPIRTPSAMNGAYQDVMLWNGQFGGRGTNAGTEAAWTADTPKENNHFGYEGLETQALAGLTVHRLVIDPDVLEAHGYTDLFEAAFPDRPDSARVTTETAALAIAAYERTLLANRSPWQEWLRGRQGAMSDEEKQGALLFFGKADCVSCHSGPSLASTSFHAFGMDDLDRISEPTFGTRADNGEHLGRGGFTGNPAENYRFKTPQLYNLTDSPFYGHGSSMRSVKEVVEYKNEGQSENDRVPEEMLSPLFRPLGLSSEEVEQLTVFLENALRDPDLLRYVPASLPSGSCFPNNDPPSRIDRECD